jgi:predicted HicB family RNase H-like nuclease
MQNVNAHTVTTGGASLMTQEASTQSAPVSEIYKHLNFKVPPEFHREFKTFAASHDISMTALLIEAFHTLRESH